MWVNAIYEVSEWGFVFDKGYSGYCCCGLSQKLICNVMYTTDIKFIYLGTYINLGPLL